MNFWFQKIVLCNLVLALSEFAYSGIDDSITVVPALSQATYDSTAIYGKHWVVNQTFVYPADAKPVLDSSGIMLCDTHLDCIVPVENFIVGDFGPKEGYFHKGTDINLNTGDPVLAAFNGKVRYAQFNEGGYGNLVIIRHPNGLETYYAHLSKLKVKINQWVDAGDLIGLGGNTGLSYAPHLHFEVRLNDQPIDPARIFDFETFTLHSDCVDLDADLFEAVDGSGSSLNVVTMKKSTQPIKKSTHSSGIYLVKSGDCLSSIARDQQTTIDALCKKNGLTRTSVLQIGQRLKL